MVGFRAVIDGFGDMAVCAATPAKARYQVWKRAQEAGYTSVTFGAIRIRKDEALAGWASWQASTRVTNFLHALGEPRPTKGGQ